MAARDMLRMDPKDRDAPQKAAEFYFAVCSMQVDAAGLAAAGATLANGGVAPYSGERVFSQETAGRVLSVMGHSGMYNDSGKFSDQVGLPAKSGVSGNVMMVLPDKRMAVVTFSPRLDEAGNSVRGVEVCRQLVEKFGLHPYKSLGAGRELSSAAEASRRALGGMPAASSRSAGVASSARPQVPAAAGPHRPAGRER